MLVENIWIDFNKLSALGENSHTLNFRHITHVLIRRNSVMLWGLLTKRAFDLAKGKKTQSKHPNKNQGVVAELLLLFSLCGKKLQRIYKTYCIAMPHSNQLSLWGSNLCLPRIRPRLTRNLAWCMRSIGSVQMYRKWFVFLQQSKISHFSFCNPTTSVLVIFCKSVSLIQKP